MHKRFFIILFGILVMIGLLSPKIYLIFDVNTPFRSKEWKSADIKTYYSPLFSEFALRKRMLRRLEKQYTLIGMSRNNLYKLLGKSEGYILTGEEIYPIGYGFLDRDYVGFKFEKDKIVSYRHVSR